MDVEVDDSVIEQIRAIVEEYGVTVDEIVSGGVYLLRYPKA